ncbi:unnamed protein product [Cyprideis torosa]|uniref:DNA-directed RNA polymerase I subunit D n=1 Tax=Cyprideis torosa TaxID=163714 RepID=A0A7R8W6V5_9CRUS|nr:unnamed protein product [Cyprideis torosa]CAG0885630.1 unnamed protein product [Cyprideis torosa]
MPGENQTVSKGKLTTLGDCRDETCQTFVFDGEGHSLGNALRWVIVQNPDVIFCGYSLPHPSEQKFHLRIQTRPKGPSAADALVKGLKDLRDSYAHIRDVFQNEVQAWSSAPATAEAVSEAPIPPPPGPGEQKVYSPKIVQLVDSIAELNLMEVADLNELLKKKLNIPDAAPMMMAPGVQAVGGASEEAGEEDAAPAGPVTVTLKLLGFDETKKVQLIKEVKAISEGEMNLVQAKKFVESTPQVFRAGLSQEEAEKLKAQLEAAGGKLEID